MQNIITIFNLRMLSKFCDKWFNIIIKVFNIHILVKIHKSKGIPNILRYP